MEVCSVTAAEQKTLFTERKSLCLLFASTFFTIIVRVGNQEVMKHVTDMQ